MAFTKQPEQRYKLDRKFLPEQVRKLTVLTAQALALLYSITALILGTVQRLVRALEHQIAALPGRKVVMPIDTVMVTGSPLK